MLPSRPSVVQLRDWFDRETGRVEATVGGPARLRVIVLLASVLGLNTADIATVGAIAGELERSLHLDNTEVGLLVTVTTAIGALATLPMGVLTDRVNRTRLLWISILIWSGAMIVNGLSVSFLMLVLSRLALGAVVATAGPATTSLTGDLFPPGERSRIYGYILTGELLGTGLGFLVSGDLAGVLSWRVGFFWLAVPGLVLAWAIRRYLPEPARGGQSRLEPGDTHIRTADEAAEDEAAEDEAADDGPDDGPDGGPDDAPAAEADAPVGETEDVETEDVEMEDVEMEDVEEGEVGRKVVEEGIPPHEHLVLHEDPTGKSLWWSVRYVLAIRTNLILIVASALGYYFLQGLETFAVVYMRGRYGLGQSSASSLLVVVGLGAIVGVLVSGHVADRLIGRRHVITARPVVAGAALLIAVGLFVPGLLVPNLLVAAPLFFLAAAGLGGANPPLDAARLDLMHSRLWGRAESVRTALRTALQAIAPLVFGYVSIFFGGQSAGLGHPSGAAANGGAGLDYTFLIMLAPLIVAGLLLLLRARRTYPRDVATAVCSERLTEPQPDAADG